MSVIGKGVGGGGLSILEGAAREEVSQMALALVPFSLLGAKELLLRL